MLTVGSVLTTNVSQTNLCQLLFRATLKVSMFVTTLGMDNFDCTKMNAHFKKFTAYLREGLIHECKQHTPSEFSLIILHCTPWRDLNGNNPLYSLFRSMSSEINGNPRALTVSSKNTNLYYNARSLYPTLDQLKVECFFFTIPMLCTKLKRG